MIRVLLVDNHEIVRAGIRLLIDAQHDMTVIGEASSGEEALQRVRSLQPDVAVVDLAVPVFGGLRLARALRDDATTATTATTTTTTTTTTKIVILTRHDDEAYVRESLDAGTAAYVLKHSQSSELLEAIRAAARNERYLDSNLKQNIARRDGAAAAYAVTPRERDVLRLTAAGHSNKEIASQLNISVRTVEVHKTNGMRKLQLGGRADVVRYAVLHGWMRDP